MIKSLELSNPRSCLNKARDDEMLFVMLGRDRAAVRTIRNWIKERILLGLNAPGDAQLLEAEAIASQIQHELPLTEFEKFIRIAVDALYSHNAWIQHYGMEIYLRYSFRYVNDEKVRSLEICNVNALNPGRGAFTRFLQECEEFPNRKYKVVYVENIITERFQEFLAKRDYIKVPDLWPVSMFKSLGT